MRGDQLDSLIARARGRFDHLSVASTPLETLPLLERYRRRKRGELDGARVVFAQHQLAPLTARVGAMQRDGLQESDAWFLDIPYSTNSAVRAAIGERIGDRRQMLDEFRSPFSCYHAAQQRRTAEIQARIASRPATGPIVVVDDGAHFLRRLAARDTAPELAERFRGARFVEQTTRGHRFLESATGHRTLQDLEIAAVSVARTSTKVRFEAPFIGAAVARSIRAALRGCDLQPRRALIIGYGSVGAASAAELVDEHGGLECDVVDTNGDRLDAARTDGHRAMRALPAELAEGQRYDLIVGCTGGTSFTWENRGLLQDDAVLVSGSSCAVELDRARLVELADRDPHDDFEILNDRGADRENIHADIRFAHGRSKKLTLLNAGFPVNFDGEPEHIPTVLIQATHCLLYAGVLQAMEAESSGLRLLEPTEDHWIQEQALADLEAALDGGDPALEGEA